MRSLALLLLVSACHGDPPGWTVAGGFLRDPEGRVVILRGVNLSGRHKLPPYLDFHGPDDYRRLRDDWGMNAIRFLVTWSAIEPVDGVHDPAFLDEVAERIGWAEDAGLLVFLDMHQDLYGEGFAGGDGAPRWSCDPARYSAFTPRTPWFFGYLDGNVTACFDALWTDAHLHDHYAALWGALARLPEREREVVRLRYGLGGDPVSTTQVGALLGITRQRVQQLEAKALDRLAHDDELAAFRQDAA